MTQILNSCLNNEGSFSQALYEWPCVYKKRAGQTALTATQTEIFSAAFRQLL
jgi:hypothetical protein